ncbi:hypothetical protein [Paenibacillus sp. KN14-4R]|uniref:hypothetical protein n=1 Tax=Paenibacillus sp. KN14-4R TaxID=3445773 RepID=UPI003F9EF3B9
MKKRFFRAQDGAVTMYLVLIIVPIFLLIGVLIDFSRTKAAEMETEQAVKAGVRSILSAYNPDLHKWGLYGVGISDADASKMFSNVVSQNVSGANYTDAFRYLYLSNESEKSQVELTRTLGQHAVFKQQVLEEMKYRAPISFTLEIVDKIINTGAASHMTKGSEFSKHAEEIQKLIDKREDLLDEAWDESEKMHKYTTRIHSTYDEGIRKLQELAGKIGSNTKEMLQSQLDTLTKNKTDDKEEDASNKSAREAIEEILRWIAEYELLRAALNLCTNNDLPKLMDHQVKIDQLVKKAKDENSKLRTEIQKLRTKAGGSSTNNTTDASSSHGSLAVEDVFDHVKIRDDEYFTKFQIGPAQVPTSFKSFQVTLSGIQLQYGTDYDTAIKANDAYYNLMNTFYNTQSVIEKKRMDENLEVENQKNNNRKKIKDVLRQIDQVANVCDDKATDPVYEKLEGKGKGDTGLFGKYLDLNTGKGGATPVSYEMKDPDNTTKKSMNLMGLIAEAAEGARNELLMNEFALTKFNYRTFGDEMNNAKQVKKNLSLNDPANHKLPKQEAEYLLYGFSSCKTNLRVAYAEMFSLRFGIRTMEALMDPKNKPLALGSPLLVILAAAAEGAYEAYKDMNALLKGEAVEISAKLAGKLFTFNYSDYLRLFYLLHTNDTNLMARMQALIEMNTGADLSNTATYVRGTTSIKSSLWFVPGMMKLIGLGSGSVCTIEGRTCEITKSADMGYE